MKRIAKKDKVVVISGRYKGSVGIVLQVLTKENRVIVEGVNKVRRATKGEGADGYKEKEAPIHISNVALVDHKTEKPIKVGFKMEDGKKVRINRKTGEVVNRQR